jgi:hypothetical protein
VFSPPANATASRSKGRHLFALLAVLIGAILCLSAFRIYSSQQRASADLFDPKLTTAYTNLLDIAADLAGYPDPEDPAAFVAQNQSALAALHRAIQQPVEAPQTYYPFAAAGWRLTHALIAEAKYAENQKRYRDAADIYFDTLRLGERLEHGPLLKPTVGISAQRMALTRLHSLIPNLSNQDLSDLAPALRSFNRDRITFDELMRRNRYYTPTANIAEMVRLQFSSDFRKFKKHLKEQHLQLKAETEIAADAMAALRYTRETQTQLTNVQSLVPKYLKQNPTDPYAQTPLRLHPSTNGIAIIYAK